MSDKPGVWMLTASFNDHDQHGPVPCCVWQKKPSVEELVAYFAYDTGQPSNVMGALAFVLHVQGGGGRRGTEHQWYDLDFVPFGKRLDRDD